MAIAITSLDTHQRPCGTTGLTRARIAGKAVAFTLSTVIRGNSAISTPPHACTSFAQQFRRPLIVCSSILTIAIAHENS
jgi:hypothetical protein